MVLHALAYPSLQRRSRPLFLTSRTQHLRRMQLAREALRAVLALVALTAWATLAILLAA
jgi:hypothetical protein